MKRIGFVLGLATIVTLAGLVSAQGAGDAARGKKLFEHDAKLEYPSCAHCHATVSAEEELKKTGHIRIAFPVFNSANRGAWKNKPAGKDPKSPGWAGNICAKAFQKIKGGLTAAQVADLDAYIKTVSPGEAKPRKIKYAPKIPESLDGGDAAEGKKKIATYCSTCHGASDDHLQFELKAGKYPKLKVAHKVRGWYRIKGKMKFAPYKGSMSFFAKNRLSDKDLLDIIAYLKKD